mmetsp:Transcript_4837/g.6261  ORF Transcript_4837/g.6261 Transcript_4837/m.6261 type:complete len:250 (+) Transcript_4837:126-875(+)
MSYYYSFSFLVLSMLASATMISASDSSSYTSSAFIQAASPNNSITKSVIKTKAGRIIAGRQVAGVHPSFGQDGVTLFAKKKKDTTVGKGGKVQVKLVKHVAGTGQAGDIIMVAPAFFTNKLQKTGSAIRITDEEVAKEAEKQASHEKELKANASDVKHKLEEMKFSITKKAGPDGHLFGGVGMKLIMTELKKEFPQGCLDGKQVKITQIKDGDGKKLQHDIKEVGDYSLTISLLKGVAANLDLSVMAKE